MNFDDFKTIRHELNRPLLIITGSKGSLACGYLSLDAFEKLEDAAAIVRGVGDFDDMLKASIQDVSSKAKELGVEVGMTGEQALELLK